MISHTYIGTDDLSRAAGFYGPIMEAMDLELLFRDEAKGWIAWRKRGTTRPLFLVGRPFDGASAHPGNGVMVALLAPRRGAVDEVYTLALEGGGRSEGEPGLRPQYHPDYYGAYFRDPDGNKICVCCHDPE